MPNRTPCIRKADVERAVKGVMAAGLGVARVEIANGRLVIHTNESADHPENPLEAWRRHSGAG